jgi:glyoxylase-like metal-dependent hydrolase (beta-lactamase superfamily II)
MEVGQRDSSLHNSEAPAIPWSGKKPGRSPQKPAMNKISVLDTNWVGHPKSIAAVLLESENYRAIIDPGPESTLATLREQLRLHGLTVADLDAILLTHIHLDHAGATGALVRENPELTVYVHASGARHLADPAKLLASATRLWGAQLAILFGETLPVPLENIRTMEGPQTLTLGARKLDVEYTPGHASHHVSYFDADAGVAFIGDTAGIRIDNGPYILPATPPPDIDLPLWDQSFATILARRPARLLLTHYGYSDNPAAHIAEFRERLHHWAATAEEALAAAAEDPIAQDPHARDAAAMNAFVKKSRAEMNEKLGAVEAEHHAFTGALELSFLGLARYIRKRNEAAT